MRTILLQLLCYFTIKSEELWSLRLGIKSLCLLFSSIYHPFSLMLWCVCQRSTSTATTDDNKNAAIVSTTKPGTEKERGPSPSSLVFGYLNLFSDGVVSLCSYRNDMLFFPLRYVILCFISLSSMVMIFGFWRILYIYSDTWYEYCSTTLLMEWL